MTTYDQTRDDAAGRSRQKSMAGRNIAPVPPVADRRRRNRACKTLRAWCETYHKETFYLPWSPDHLKALARLDVAIKEGGQFAVGMPRGSGKTQMALAAAEYATLNGFRRFVLIVGSDESSSVRNLDSIKGSLETNELLYADFPEICYPIACLEGIAQRSRGQHVDGARTYIQWEQKQITLPTIKGSPASGASIGVAGITGRIRGLVARDAEGRAFRPDLVIVDDPQTDESAHSPSQCQTRERIVEGAIMGLAGPDKKITVVMPCTVIRQGDLADTFLDRHKKPAWKGERFQLLYSLPKSTALWDQYADLRRLELRESEETYDTPKANSFYRDNRKAMDDGSIVAWPQRKQPSDISALQYAMNLSIDNAEAFWAEYQNQPRPKVEQADQITADQIAARVNGLARGVVPAAATRLVAFIDVQKTALFWVVCAFAENFTGHVVDYGVWPKQTSSYFQLRDLRRTLALAHPTVRDLEGLLYVGLESLVASIARDWPRDDGTSARLDRIMIDANWGPSTDVVYRFAQDARAMARITPSHGRYVRASSREWLAFRVKPGERGGPGWRMTRGQSRKIKHLIYNTNHWKSFAMTRLVVPVGAPSGISLFGDDPAVHRLLVDHLLAEFSTRVEAEGRVVDEWQLRPERMDNHWLDGLVGCCVGASVEGVAVIGAAAPKRKREKISLAALAGGRR
jgi:hypothetical protein